LKGLMMMGGMLGGADGGHFGPPEHPIVASLAMLPSLSEIGYSV
jgi:hypothetical protein